MKAVTRNSRENGISGYRDFRERRIAHRVRHSVTENSMTQLDPRVSRESTSVTPHPDPNAVPGNPMRVEHAAESHSLSQAKRLKESVTRRPVDGRGKSFAGLALSDRGPRGGDRQVRCDLHEFAQWSHPSQCLRQQ